MSKILLIDPNYGFWEAGTICRQSQFEPLGIEYIGAKVQQTGHEVDILQQRHTSDDQVVQKIQQFNPDIVGFSVITCTFATANRIAKKLKSVCPDIVTIFGGYHASAFPEICKDEVVDYIVIGEGEETFLELIQNLELNRNINETENVAFYDGKLIINSPRERINNLNTLSPPIRKMEILKECKIESLSWPPVSLQKSVAQVIFSRGCPFNCTFCCSPNLWGRAVKFRSPQSVITEVKQLKEKYGTNYIFFADLTFNLDKKKLIELCMKLIETKLDIYWYSMCRVDNVASNIISLMEKAGCTKIAYGIDALNSITCSKIKPHQKITMEIMRRSLSVTQNSSIITRAFLMIGYPWENKQDLFETKEMVKRLPIDDLRIGILTPLPGSTMYEEFKREGLLLHEDFSKYTTEECVVKLNNIAPEEIYEIREQIFREFYQSKEYEQRMKEKTRKYPHLMQSYDEFFKFLDRKGVFS